MRLTALLLLSAASVAVPAGEPFNPAQFREMGVVAAWEKYAGTLTWGRGQCLAILDDGCDVSTPEWRSALPWGAKVLATWNSIDGNEDCAPVKPGYHGTTVGYPSSLNHAGRLGVAHNNFVAHVRCVTVVHLRDDQSASMARALRWVADHHARLGITAVNLSPLDDQAHRSALPGPIDAPLKTLRALGIWVSAPCGNHGFTTGISWPACARHCFAIGASRPGTDTVHLDRFTNTDLLAPATATSSANAYAVAASMILREAIHKSAYRWQTDGANLPEAMVAIFKRTGTDIPDPATGLTFKRIDLLRALDHVLEHRRGQDGGASARSSTP